MKEENEIEISKLRVKREAERDGRKIEAIAFQSQIDDCDDQIQKLKEKLREEHLKYDNSLMSCEGEIIKLVRSAFTRRAHAVEQLDLENNHQLF